VIVAIQANPSSEQASSGSVRSSGRIRQKRFLRHSQSTMMFYVAKSVIFARFCDLCGWSNMPLELRAILVCPWIISMVSASASSVSNVEPTQMAMDNFQFGPWVLLFHVGILCVINSWLSDQNNGPIYPPKKMDVRNVLEESHASLRRYKTLGFSVSLELKSTSDNITSTSPQNSIFVNVSVQVIRNHWL